MASWNPLPVSPPRPAGRAAVLALLCACAPEEPELPPGLLVSGEVGAARGVLETLKSWEGVRIAGWASRAEAEIVRCEQRFSLIHNEAGATVACRDLPDLAGLPQGHLLAFALPEAGPGRLVGWVEPGATLRAEAVLRDPASAGAWDLLLPHADPPGPWRLSGEQALVRLRGRSTRPGAISELASAGGQADTMFGLKSDLFAGAILDGTWEFAIYLPEEGMKLPRVALAVGVRSESLARSALDQYTRQIEQTWNTRLTRALPGLEGCFLEMNMLPDLAPCAFIANGILGVGWNQRSLEHARSGGGDEPLDGAVLRVAMDLFPQADAALSAVYAPGEPAPTVSYPWRQVELRARRVDRDLQVSLELWPR